MADILIRGMDAPQSCYECVLTHSFFRNLRCDKLEGMSGFVGPLPHTNDRHPDCPIGQLPEGHGRLIDADAFEDAFIRYYLSQERNNHLVFTPVEIKQHLADMIGDWPTIVPAEGGLRDGQ
jgi:hypothetical protein